MFRQIAKELVGILWEREFTKIKCRTTFLVKIMNIIGARKKERKKTHLQIAKIILDLED